MGCWDKLVFLSGTEEPPTPRLLFSNSFFLVSALSMSLGTKSQQGGGVGGVAVVELFGK